MIRLGFDRRGAVPRSALFLGALLVLALVVLFFLRRNPAPPDYTLGGKLFDVSLDRITGLQLTRSGVQFRLDRTEGDYWTLSGAQSDFLDQAGVASLLESLTQATGGSLLAGTEPEDRRYEFNGPEALRLTVFVRDSEPIKLAIGTRNPVTGAYYGSGAGRVACFSVAPGLRDLLTQVPDRLRLRTLLPDFDREQVTRVEIQRGEQTDLLERMNSRWWLRLPAGGTGQLGAWYRDYIAFYQDRIRTDGSVTWLLASDPAVRAVIYESSQTVVREMAPAADNARLKVEFDLEEPWRRVRLSGTGINPDPSAGSPDQLELDFALEAAEDRVPAARRGNVLVTEAAAIAAVSEPVSSLLDDGALGLVAALADSLVLEREGQVLLRAHRDRRPAAPGERFKKRPVDFWLTDFTTPGPGELNERARNHRSQNLLTNLDRTPILRVLPSSDDPDVLQPTERIRLVLHFAPGPPVPGVGTGTLVLEIGYLDPVHLPAGSGELAHFPDDELPPVGLWRPDTGQLLQIPGYTLTTARAWAP